MCVEPNDAERHSLHESDAEISELESEILGLNLGGKKLLNFKWNVTSLFFKNIEDTLKKEDPFELRLTTMWQQNLGSEHAFSGVKFHNAKGHLISNKPYLIFITYHPSVW